MPADVVVRALEFGELDALLVLYGHLHPEDDPLPPRPQLEALWCRMQDDPALVYCGGFVDGRLVSACNAVIVPNLTRGARPYAVIENVVTHADFRRQGIGAAVLRSLLAECWARDCYKVMLLSGRRRAAVYAFYEALGFDRDAKQAFVITSPRVSPGI
jgi:GNAT superfamily N-acetyltransferase